MSVISNRDRDCLGCRLVSGAGLLGIGCYLGYYARKNQTPPGKLTISTFSLGFIVLGVARLTSLYPFDKGDRPPTQTVK